MANNQVAVLQSISTLLAGTFISGLITVGLYFIKARADHMERTIALHREFCSLEFIQTRNRAYVLLACNPDKTFMELSKDLTIQDEFIHLLRMLTFYEHLSISVTSGYLNRKAAQSYFGEIFVWWYVNYFESKRGLPSTEWELRPTITALYKHFERNAKRDFDRWLKHANDGPQLEREGIAKLARPSEVESI